MADKEVTPPVVAPDAVVEGPVTLPDAELDAVSGGQSESRPLVSDHMVVSLGWGFGNGFRAEVEGNYRK